MTTYEILLMLDPEQAEARQDDVVARARELVEKNGGTWHSHDAWGRRRLAYPIAHKEEGVYHLVVFDAEAATLDEISRVLKIEDAVLRHMATRHIEGSRTSAPRDEAAAPAAPPAEATAAETVPSEPVAAETAEPETTVSEEAEPEYAGEQEQAGAAGSAAGEAGDARPEDRGEEE
ncbi:MAG TPA: 30S ribosomal protein S6 [Gaiellaceae bacterium]|nr:30S ribosomal protein S6 [Gaiellaceae bacterium]